MPQINPSHRIPPRGLLDACIVGDAVAAARFIHSNPEQIEARDSYSGAAPLILAAHRGHEALVEMLLNNGAEVSAIETSSGATALHWAARAGHRSIVERLVGAGSDLEGDDEWFGLPPSGWASVLSESTDDPGSQYRIVTALTRGGTAPDVFTVAAAASFSKMEPAVRADREEALRTLIRDQPKTLRRRMRFAGDGFQPLHLAIQRGWVGTVDLLLQLGADSNAVTMTGWSCAALAHSYQSDDDERCSLLSLLHRYGARPDLSEMLARRDWQAVESALSALHPEELSNGRYRFLLHEAAAIGWEKGTNVLLKAGANIRLPLKRIYHDLVLEMRPLHLAAWHGHPGVTRILLDTGADPNEACPGPWHATALHLAAASGHDDVARALLERGADKERVDSKYHATPAGWAKHTGATEMATLLAERTIDEPAYG